MFSAMGRRWLNSSFAEMGWPENGFPFRDSVLVGDITTFLPF